MMNGMVAKEEPCSSQDQVCCLYDGGTRCIRPAGNAAYNKRIQRTVMQRKLKLQMDALSSHNHICEYHKSAIQSVRGKRKRRHSDDDSGDHEDQPDVDFCQLQVNTLRKYKRHYKLPNQPGLNKAQLVEVISQHFKTIPVHEKEALTYFLYMVKSGRSKFDHRNGANTD